MKTVSPKSHIEQVRTISNEHKENVMSLLDMSEQEYCNLQFYNYWNFVEKLTQDWPKVREAIMYSPVFRGFWNNEWSKRDEEFLAFAVEFVQSKNDLMYCYGEYLLIHDHRRLLEDDEFMTRYNQILKIL